MRRGAWLLVLLSLAACATSPRRPTPPLSPEVRALLEELEARWKQFEDLRGIVELRLERRETRQRFTGPLLLKAPASLRFEALSPLGQPLLVVAMDGELFTLYSLHDDRAVVGPATERAMGRWLDLPLPPVTVVALLAGHVLPPPEISAGALVREGDHWRLDLRQDGAFMQRIWLDPLGRQPWRVEWEGGGMRIEAILGSDHGVTLRIPERGMTLSLHYQERDLDVGLPPARFRVELPEGTPVTRIP